MKILSKMMLTFVALALVSMSVFAQTQKSVKDPNAPSVPRATEVGRALGDDCLNPYLVDMSTLPLNYTDNQPSGTCGHGNNYDGNPDLGSYDNGDDVVYKLMPTQDVDATFNLDGATTPGWGNPYHSIALYEGCPSATNSPLVYVTTGAFNPVNLVSINYNLHANVEYFFVVDYWGSSSDPCLTAYDLTVTAVPASARLEATADPINLGDWPIGAWQDAMIPAEFTNTGTANASITAIDLEDLDNAFTVVDPVNLPYSLGVGQTATLSNLKGSAVTPGVHEGQYVVSYGSRAVATADITMNAYAPVEGDVWENPIVATLPYSVAGASTAAPMHKNYYATEAHMGKDVVYKFTLASDQEVDINIYNASDFLSTILYCANFKGEPGPMLDNTIAFGAAAIEDQQLFAGDYYVVIAGTNAASDITYDLEINSVDMPAPAKPINPNPAHLATGINANGTVATWDFADARAKQYRVYFGNTLPLDEVLPWTDVDGNSGSIALPNMDPNMQYFWRVDVRNDHHEVEGDVWVFTTQLTTPTNLIAQVTGSPANDVNLSWELDAPRIFRYFNVYRDGAQIASNITATSYQDMDVAHGCYEYQVEAVYDEGTSAMSDAAEACIYGNGMHHGVVKDAYTDVVLEDVTIAYEGVAGTVAEGYSYTVTTDANGYYEVEAHEGLYDITITKSGYVSQNENDALVTYDVDNTRNYFLTEETNPVTDEIRAFFVGDNVEINWDARSDRSLLSYNVYRVNCYDETQSVFLGSTVDKTFTDHNWSTLPYGTYKWGIEVVYDAGTSPMAYSNCLDKDMLTTVNVTVTTNSGDSPEGTHVTFTNISEPAMNLVYELDLDATGIAILNDFRKGVYDIMVQKDGFEPLSFPAEVIVNDAYFNWELVELHDAPINLWVSPLGYAQWDLPFGNGAGDGTMIDVDFEGGAIPADWSVEDLGSTAGVDLWYVTDSYTNYGTTYQLNGTQFAFINSDAAGSGTTVSAALVSPEVNNATAANVTLEFEQFFRPYGGYGDVDVWDGSAWQTVLHQTAQAGDWSNADMQSIDVTAYRNANFKVRFNYQGSWAYYWAVDNVKVFDNTRGATAAADRAPLHYQVWLDGAFAANADETHYQHDVAPLTLGDTYTTEVAIVYTTGMSDKASYEWTYLDCDHFQHPVTATTEYDPQLSPEYVTVSWTNNAPVAGATLLGANLYRDGSMIAFVEAPATSYADSTNTGLIPGNSYEYCLRAVYTNDGGNHTWMSCEGTTCTTFDMPEILPAPINLTATIVDTTNVELNWELPANSTDYTFQSFTVYKDGVVLATGLTTTTYTNINLPLGCYTYEVEAIYAEGISPKSLPAEACVIGTATVKGTVTDVTTGLPIEGATVALDGDVDYTFTTDADGMYEAEVWEGEYDYEVSAEAYQTQNLTAVTVALNTVEVRDFALDDEYQSIDAVVAVELDPATVKVSWDGSNPNNGTWLQYGNGVNTNAIAIPSGAPFAIAHKYPVGSMDAYAGGTISKVKMFLGEGLSEGTIKVWQGANAEDLIYEQTFTDYTVDDWNEFMLASPVAFDVTKDLWVGYSLDVYTPGTFPAGAGDPAGADADWTFLNDEWAHLVDFGLANSWNFGFFVTSPAKNFQPTYVVLEDNTNYGTGTLTAVKSAKQTVDPFTNAADRVVTGYNVYRVKCFDESNPVFLGSTPDSVFSDHNWGDMPFGNYKWGVERVYTNGVSEMAYSNCLDKDMLTSVSVTVTTNSGDSPAGTVVTFTNISEPALEYTHEFVLDDTGMATYDALRKGHYDITVVKNGFETVSESDIVIESPQQFEWMLIEQFLAPLNLWVSPTGYATWDSPVNPNPNPGGGINADFNNGMPAGWEVVDNGSTAGVTLWEVIDVYTGQNSNGTLDGTPFAIINSDAAGSGTSLDAYLVSPVVDNSADANVTLQFVQNFQHITGNGFSAVEVWNGSEWVEVLHQEEDIPSAGSISETWSSPVDVTLDLTAHKNANFQVRFHYTGAWCWFWAIDNVQVSNSAKAYAANNGVRGVQGYKVWLDNVYEADTDTTWYQHDVANLTEGESYTTEVATVFATGISEKASYTWTYVPCDQYEGPKGIAAERVDNTQNALVTWTYNGVPGDEWTEGFEGGSLPADWEIVQTNTNSAAGQAAGYWTINEVSGDDFAPFGTYQAGLWWDYGHQDEWLITKPFTCPGNATFTFSAVCFEGSTYGDHYYVKVSEDNGTTWTALWDASALTGNDWNHYDTPYSLDLSAYAGKEIKMAFQAVDGDGQGLWYIFFVDNVAVSTAKNKHAIVFDELSYESKARQAGKVMSNPAFARDGMSQVVEVSAPQAPKFDRDVEHIGTNVYRDGEFLAYVANPDTAYVDITELELGATYRYCVAAVYTDDGGAHTWTSCIDGRCVDFTMPEDCAAPKNLTASDLPGDGKKVTLEWKEPWAIDFDPTWLQYDDGNNENAIGAGGTPFGVAHKYPAGTMDAYEGGVITKVKMYLASGLIEGSIKVWQGANGENLIYEQAFTDITADSWNEFDLDTPVAYDVTQDLWVGYSLDNYTAGTFPAGVGAQTNVDGDWTLFDGAWAHLVDLAPTLVYTWNLGFYVDAPAKGFVAPTYVALEDNTNYGTDASLFAASGVAGNAVDPFTNAAAQAERGLLGYNVYRDGVKVNSDLVTETTYVEMNLPGNETYCWQVTAVYEFCGESDFSNEVCLDVYEGVNEYDNTINIYPNPAKDYVKIDANSTIDRVLITNMAGQVVRNIEAVSATYTTIDTQAFGAGVYFVEVSTANGAQKVKLVITK